MRKHHQPQRRANCPWYHFFSSGGIPETSLRVSDDTLCCNGQTRTPLLPSGSLFRGDHPLFTACPRTTRALSFRFRKRNLPVLTFTCLS